MGEKQLKGGPKRCVTHDNMDCESDFGGAFPRVFCFVLVACHPKRERLIPLKKNRGDKIRVSSWVFLEMCAKARKRHRFPSRNKGLIRPY